MIPLKKPGTCLPAGRCKAQNFPGTRLIVRRRLDFFQQNHYIIKHESVLYFMGWRKHMTMSLMKSLFTKELCMIINKYSVNPLSALKRLPFSGFQSSLIADRRGSAIRPAIETLQKANRSKAGHGRQPFTGGDISGSSTFSVDFNNCL